MPNLGHEIKYLISNIYVLDMNSKPRTPHHKCTLATKSRAMKSIKEGLLHGQYKGGPNLKLCKSSFVKCRDMSLIGDDTQPKNIKVDLVQTNACAYRLFMNSKISEIVKCYT